MHRFREKVKQRGARGMIGLQRLFKIMDDDGSKSLNEYEFGKAIHDFRVEMPEEQIHALFDAFDFNDDGTVNYDEFLRSVRGEMNEFRRELVLRAFTRLDRDGSGVADIEDVRGIYNAAQHPDVVQGKKSEDQILMEFLETFEAHHNLKTGSAKDATVTADEFIEYYNNISASIDDDMYFELMINNAWNVKGNAPTYKKYAKGWSNQAAPEQRSSA